MDEQNLEQKIIKEINRLSVEGGYAMESFMSATDWATWRSIQIEVPTRSPLHQYDVLKNLKREAFSQQQRSKKESTQDYIFQDTEKRLNVAMYQNIMLATLATSLLYFVLIYTETPSL